VSTATRTLEELIAGTGAEVLGDSRVAITGIASHSKQVKPGSLFVAIDGFAASGREYVNEAINQGARAVAGASLPETGRQGVSRVRIVNPRRFLALVANRFYGFPARAVRVVGITGTNGKTTVSYLVRSILEAAGERSGLIGTIRHFDGREWLKAVNTTPESVDIAKLLAGLRDAGIRYCVAEVSSHAIALDRVAEIEFAVGVFTNLTQDHLDFHRTMDEYREVKLRFFRELGPAAYAIYNRDDPTGEQIPKATRVKKYSYGLKGASGTPDIGAEIRSLTDRGTSLRLTAEGRDAVINSGLIGTHNVYNILAAAGAATALGLTLPVIKTGVERLKAVPGRMERIDNSRGLSVFVDYAHSPDALERLISAARALNPRQVLVVFGCGGNRDKTKRPVMGRIATLGADKVIITSDNPRDEDPERIIAEIKAGAQRENFETIPNRYAAIKRALFLASKGDIVLIAGKGHEDYQIIGRETLHFDDRETVRAVLRTR
jgi:UDP-N-acetylmuramoyl-L-alanyl-D-glutamate--2,6-diaminopimelate ligase